MILTVDIGNTNITFGAYLKEELRFVARMATDRLLTSDQYAVQFKQIISLYISDKEAYVGAIISSVVPELTGAVKRAIERIAGVEPLVLGPGVKNGLDIKIDNPAQLGADLVAAAVGAINKYPLPCLVVDLGTASKISVIDKGGVYRGCTIAAGVGISLQALSSKTSQLPAMAMDSPSSVIGTNSVTSMQSGVIYGTAAMIDGMCDRIEKALGSKVESVVATGGWSVDIIKHCNRTIISDDNLVLHGLYVIYQKNKAKKYG